MSQRIFLATIVLIFLLAKYNCTLQSHTPSDLLNPTNGPYQIIMSDTSWILTKIMSFPPFKILSEELTKFQNAIEDGCIQYQRTYNAFKTYLFLLTSTLETTHLIGDPIEDELRNRQGIEDLKKDVTDLNSSIIRIKEQNLPFHQLFDDAGKLYQEKCSLVLDLQGKYSICSIERGGLAVEIDKAELDKNITLREINDLEPQVEDRRKLLRDNYLRQDKIKKELTEYFDKIRINIHEVSESYKMDFINGKQKLLESKNNGIKEIDAQLLKLELQAGDLGSAQINHFILVLDHSGSMEGEKWNQVIKAVRYFIEANRHQGLHEITIIIFGSSVHTHLKAQKFLEYTEPREDLPWDLTDYDNVMEAVKNAIPLSKARPIVLFLTDGLPTTCNKAYNTLDSIHAQYSERGLMLFGLGVGNFDHQVLLELIKRANAGNEYFANENGKIPFLHTTQDEKVLYQIFLNVSTVAQKSGEEIDNKIRWLRNEKRILMNETQSLIRASHEFYTQSTKELSAMDQIESKYVEELEQKLTLLGENEEKTQADLRDLHSKINSLAISPNRLKDLQVSYTHKAQECENIHGNLLKGMKERGDIESNQSLAIGVFLQKDLIKKGDEILQTRLEFMTSMQSLTGSLILKVFQANRSLSRVNFSSLEEKVFNNPKSYLIQAFNFSRSKISCPEEFECLKTYLIGLVQQKEFHSKIRKPALESKIADEIFSELSSILLNQEDKINFMIKNILNWMNQEIVVQKEADWSLASYFDWIGKKGFGSSQNAWIRVGEKDLQIEERNLKNLFNSLGQDLREMYEQLIFHLWRNEYEKISNQFSRGLFDD